MPKNLLHLEFAIGFAQLKRGCIDAAKEMFGKSLHRSIELENKRMEGENLLYLSKALIAESMLDSAYQLLIRAEKLAGDNNFKEILLDIYRGVIEVAGRRKQFFQLATYQQKYIRLKREVYNFDLEKKLASLRGDWYEHENKQTIDIQQWEINERIKALGYQQWVTAALFLVVVLVLAIVVLFLRGFYLQRHSQRFLEHQVHSRFIRLKSDGYSPIYNSDRHTGDAREFSQGIGVSCRELAKLLDRCSEVPGDNSVVTHFQEVASAYIKISSISKHESRR
jgi:hypothetical protein